MEKIPSEQVDNRLKLENPWWQDPSAVGLSTEGMTPRPYLQLYMPVLKERSVRRAVVLMGPRRVGKTVMIHHAIEQLIADGVDPKCICYVSIEHPLYNGLGLEDFLPAFQRLTGIDYLKTETYIFFDEIQYLRDWEIHLKVLVDSFEKIKCTASGSAAAALRLKSAESGAGRFTDFLLPPLTFHEYITLIGEENLVDSVVDDEQDVPVIRTEEMTALNSHFVNYINFGGYPEVALSSAIQADPGRFVKNDIIDKVLLRDLPSLYGIQDVQELNHLFTTLAFNTANEVSLEQLSKGSGVSKATLKRYIEYLEASFLLKVIHRVDRNVKRFRRAGSFKVYLTNPSIYAALFSPVESDHKAMGQLVETAIFSQWFHSDQELNYARWNSGEVDIVSCDPEGSGRWAVEVKWSDRYYENLDDLTSLIRFCHAQNLPDTLVTTRTILGEKMKDSVRLEFEPAALYCHKLGRNIVSNKIRRSDRFQKMTQNFESWGAKLAPD